eukprot:TRINITY_DN3428_c0_g1_i1.p1 TRINITY_DN3428_c0_g1~~TRINITY_DN3428_c0_g1_i1.p1  ORF type:complete len:367 (+),score=56.26 TRINITY_DN3428_c0_g1_i1:458-1558(+)
MRRIGARLLARDPSVQNGKVLAEVLANVRQWGNVSLDIVTGAPGNPSAIARLVDVNDPIFAPMLHTNKVGGAMHRASFVKVMNSFFHAPEAQCNHIAALFQCMHNCSLMVDDICDSTTQRRGKPAAHVLYGIPITILCTYNIMINIFISIQAHLGPNCVAIALEEYARMHHGNAKEVYSRDSGQCPTEDEYLAIADSKTGSAFRVITRLLYELTRDTPSELPEPLLRALMSLTDDISRFFQIRDDYLDIVSEEYAKKKGGFGSDFIEGKFSFPMIHCIHTAPQTAPEFLRVLRKPAEETTQEDVKQLTEVLRQHGSLDYCLATLRRLHTSARGHCHELGRSGHEVAPLLKWFNTLSSNTPGLAQSE